jgi:hypothetical protein
MKKKTMRRRWLTVKGLRLKEWWTITIYNQAQMGFRLENEKKQGQYLDDAVKAAKDKN